MNRKMSSCGEDGFGLRLLCLSGVRFVLSLCLMSTAIAGLRFDILFASPLATGAVGVFLQSQMFRNVF